MRIVIDAQIELGGYSGGIQYVLEEIITRLTSSPQEDEYVVVLPYSGSHELRAGLPDHVQAVTGFRRLAFSQIRSVVRPFKPWLGPVIQHLRKSQKVIDEGSMDSRGFYEQLSGDLVYFPHQTYARTRLPAIYSPVDMLHRHFPEFLGDSEVEKRDLLYGFGCREAKAVIVHSQSSYRDVVEGFELDPHKVHVVPLGIPTFEGASGRQRPSATKKDQLPFLLYPAQTWPHKNHLALIDAMAILRRKGISLSLVCTGHRTEHWPVINRKVRQLGLSNFVTFTGHIERSELLELYRKAQGVVIPSLFEGVGLPVLEAISLRVPIACSNVASLPEYAGDAAVYFDPTSPEDMARAIEELVGNHDLRRNLVDKATEQGKKFSWERTVSDLRAVFRHAATG